MESFGRAGRRCGSCRELLMVCSVVLILLQQAQSLSVVARVERVPSGRNVRLSDSNDYFVFPGDNITIYCYCTNNNTHEVRAVYLELRQDRINSTAGCSPIIWSLSNISQSDKGAYECVTELTNGTIRRTPAGNLHIIDPSIIQVPGLQYGLLNSNITLNCTVNYTDSSSIMWSDPNSNSFKGIIVGVNLQHEGRYMCEIYISSIDLLMKKLVQFTVIVPPAIIRHPNTTHVTRNEQKNLTIYFRSKNSNETHISWYKDGNSLQNSITRQLGPGNALTQMVFNPIRRSDGGQYLVVIENSHGIIPRSQRRAEAHFSLLVTIVPAQPTELNVNYISATLSWTVSIHDEDESADNQTITVYYHSNDTVAEERVVGGEVRQQELSLIPGERYYTQVKARNQDGVTLSQNYTFQTLSGAPLVSEVQVRRTDLNNTLTLKASLTYTGGGSITHFTIAFRYPDTSIWIRLGNVTAYTESLLVWTAQVVDDRFRDSRIELQVAAINGNGHASNSVVQLEEIVLPAAPEQVDLVSSGYDSILLRVVLPTVGTAPLTHLEVEFFHPEIPARNITVPGINVGETVKFTLSNLQAGTAYTISVAIYNYGGRGTPSQPIQVTTIARPPLPKHGIALVAVGGAFLLVTVVIIIIVIRKKYSNVKQRKRAYSVAEAESTKFPPDHGLVKNGKRSPLSPLSPTPPTPSTTTSVLTPRPSPPVFYPPYGSTSYLPSGPAKTTSSAVPNFAQNSLPPSSFKCDTGSSRSNSVNQDSELSESTLGPRYTYTFPQPGEGTPQIPRAYDEVDLPFEEHPLPPLIANGGMLELRAHHVSHGCIRFNESRGRVAATGHKVDTESPHLRTQSTHSVATTQTRLMSSDSMSTRDGLSYTRVQANNTDV